RVASLYDGRCARRSERSSPLLSEPSSSPVVIRSLPLDRRSDRTAPPACGVHPNPDMSDREGDLEVGQGTAVWRFTIRPQGPFALEELAQFGWRDAHPWASLLVRAAGPR